MLDAPIFPRPRGVRHSEPECMQLLHHKLGIIYGYIFRCFDDGSLGHTHG
jgi:hypothetical protein